MSYPALYNKIRKLVVKVPPCGSGESRHERSGDKFFLSCSECPEIHLGFGIFEI